MCTRGMIVGSAGVHRLNLNADGDCDCADGDCDCADGDCDCADGDCANSDGDCANGPCDCANRNRLDIIFGVGGT
jgi:hypothetical protein